MVNSTLTPATSGQVGVCHGDIKLENIMVTSWGWLTLTDFASFKPVLLPEDNPADFSYFFDTSRRRTCYIAPERFVTRYSYCSKYLLLRLFLLLLLSAAGRSTLRAA